MSLVSNDVTFGNGVANAAQLGQGGQTAGYIPPSDETILLTVNMTGITGGAFVLQGSPDIAASNSSPTWSGTSAYNQNGNTFVSYNSSGITGYDNAITTFQVAKANFKAFRIYNNGALSGGTPAVSLSSTQNPPPVQVVITSVLTAPFAVQGNNAAAFTVAPSGSTNYTFQVNTNTSNAATGIEITGAAAGSGVAVQVISTGTNEALTIDAKAAAVITLAGQNSNATGVTIGSSTSAANIVVTVYSSNATAFQVGQTGATNPAFVVNCNAATSATGVKITSAAAASGVAVQVITSGTNEALTIDAAAAALVTIGGQASTALGLQVGSSVSKANATCIVYSSNAAALTVGPNGATTPTLKVACSTSSAVSGVSITSAAAGSGVALAAISSSGQTTEVITIDAKGAAAVKLGGVSTGGVYLNHGTTGIGPPIVGQTLTAVTGKQSYSATDVTAANWIAGLVALTGATGAGIITLPTGTQMTTALPPTANVTTFQSQFFCLTGQALTITGASGTTVVGTAAVPSGKNAILTWLNTGSNTWNIYVTVSG